MFSIDACPAGPSCDSSATWFCNLVHGTLAFQRIVQGTLHEQLFHEYVYAMGFLSFRFPALPIEFHTLSIIICMCFFCRFREELLFSMAGTLLRRSVALLGQRLSSSGNLGLLSVNGAAVPAASFIPYEESRRSGYKSKIKVSKREAVVKGMGMVKEEMQKLKDETLGLLRMDKLYMVEHGDYEVVWRFNDKASINKWVLTCDNDNNEGRSQAEFVLGPDQKGIFRGYLNTTVPKDGAVVRAGYANIKSLPNMVRAPASMSAEYLIQLLESVIFMELLLCYTYDFNIVQILLLYCKCPLPADDTASWRMTQANKLALLCHIFVLDCIASCFGMHVSWCTSTHRWNAFNDYQLWTKP